MPYRNVSCRALIPIFATLLASCGDGAGVEDPDARPTPVDLSAEGTLPTEVALLEALFGPRPTPQASRGATLQTSATPQLSVTPFGGAAQIAILSTPIQGFPTEAGTYLAISSGRASTPLVNSNGKFATSCVDDAAYTRLCDVAGIDIGLAVPGGAQRLEFDLRYYSFDRAPRQDPVRVLVVVAGTRVPVAEWSVGGEFPGKAGGIAWSPMRRVVVDLAPYRGQTIAVRVQASDHNDYATDSGTLVDNFVVVQNNPPRAEAGGPYSGVEGSPVTFDGRASADPDGDPLTFAWTFSDGTTSAAPTPAYSFADDGDFEAVLRVTDSAGATATDTARARIANAAPTVRIEAPDTVYSGDTLQLAMPFSDPGVKDAPWTYAVQWGDGDSSTGSSAQQAEPARAAHRYSALGTYTLQVTLADKDGARAAASESVAVARFPVAVQVKPGDGENSIKLNDNGPAQIAVAVISTPRFDARTLAATTLTLGDGQGTDTPVTVRNNGTRMTAFEDVDGDGDLDLVLHFTRSALMRNGDLTPASTQLVLLGAAEGGRLVRGVDAVRVIP